MINKTCIQEIRIFLRRKKNFIPGGIIEISVSNVSRFKPGTVNRELRNWSEDKDSVIEKSYFELNGYKYVQYRLRKTL